MKMMNLMTGRFRNFLVLFLILLSFSGKASYLLIPMDEETQTNHLKAYGMAYWVLQQDIEIEWLLNYRGGSFLLPYNDIFKAECQVRNIAFEVISDGSAQQIRTEISSPAVNMEVVKLEKAPKIAVYSPKSNQPWDDAV
ncbi:MAG TPA: asparagine synthetase B, partial [Cryomorphaceae bacterium]|nr:asparagine synthetase B [Cryomorphaceae bacterium]